MDYNVKPGLTKSVQKKITSSNTALQFGIGSLTDLLATPSLTALMIEAAVQAVDPYLPKSYISVGKALQITHLQPTTMGMMVTVKAELTEMDGGKLHFEITAYDELGEIGKGWHERIIVNRDRFMEKIRQRVKPLEENLK